MDGTNQEDPIKGNPQVGSSAQGANNDTSSAGKGIPMDIEFQMDSAPKAKLPMKETNTSKLQILVTNLQLDKSVKGYDSKTHTENYNRDYQIVLKIEPLGIYHRALSYGHDKFLSPAVKHKLYLFVPETATEALKALKARQADLDKGIIFTDKVCTPTEPKG